MTDAKKFSQVDVALKIEAISGWLKEKKGKELVLIDLRGKESYADGMVYVLPTLDSYYDSQMGFLPTKNYDPNQTLYNC